MQSVYNITDHYHQLMTFATDFSLFFRNHLNVFSRETTYSIIDYFILPEANQTNGRQIHEPVM